MTKAYRQTKADTATVVSDVVLIGSAILSVGVTLLDFVGVLDQIPWLSSRIGVLTLLSLSFLLVSVVVERKSRLERIQNTLDSILSTYALGAQYLEDFESVMLELERAVRQANENIMALGARSRSPDYLNAIQDAVLRRHVTYYRLIDGPDVAHELHGHLRALIHVSNVHTAWTPKEKFGNLTVTDQECIIAFPAPYRGKLSGLRLPGETNSRRYSLYFLEAFRGSLAVRTEHSIEAMCEECSLGIAGDLAKMRELLEEQSRAPFGEQGSHRPSLL